jgi:hypothetical protein
MQTPINPPKPYLSWETCEIATQEAKFLMSAEGMESFPKYAGKTEEQIFSDLLQDGDFFQMRWEDLCESLTELMNSVQRRAYSQDHWHGAVHNFGWRHLDGENYFHAGDGKTLLSKILPKADCSFHVFVDRRRRLISINNAHHDSPTWGEWYYLRPAKKNEVETQTFH